MVTVDPNQHSVALKLPLEGGGRVAFGHSLDGPLLAALDGILDHAVAHLV